MSKLKVQLTYQEKPSYIRAITNADFYLTGDREQALDASSYFEAQKQIKAYTFKHGCKYEPILSIEVETVH